MFGGTDDDLTTVQRELGANGYQNQVCLRYSR
jgi:hypothetical protein